jgi:crotonobetainyl-CoA:carnitine CoA-transferase CaiB-like acyl-CoA transferase
VQNLAPGAAERLGLGPAALRPGRPRLVCCSVSGYGPDGPYHRKAYDLLVQCETGLVMATGTDEAPANAEISIADIAAGIYAYSGILTALYDQEPHRPGHRPPRGDDRRAGGVDDPARLLLPLRAGAGPQNRDEASVDLALRPVPGA